VRSRTLSLLLLTWPPLVALTIIDGVARGSGVSVPLLLDYAVAVRVLIAVPLGCLCRCADSQSRDGPVSISRPLGHRSGG
jgi:hypothetical protein